ncbi:MAG: hypothetical protein E7109_09435 [Bacteroidales bacterium]|nr:hypothetical protein [Bacteroidales bacterium]
MYTDCQHKLLLAFLLLATACGPSSHIRQLKQEQVSAQLSLSEERELPTLDVGAPVHRDTLVVEDPQGREVIIMKAVKDENGEMVAHETLDAARVTARFRNVAERGGSVDLRFQILVPEKMQDSDWQLCFYPDLFVLEDSIRLEPVLITGSGYRKAQLKGYQQYRRFLESLSADSLHFVDRRQLENFLRRNIPSIYRYRTDSSFVSDEAFTSAFGVTEQRALEHYTNDLRVRLNRRKVERKEEVFRQYVKAPIVSEGLRLDTVIQQIGGDIAYEYVQSVRVRPKMRKASVILGGEILQDGQVIYRVPPSEPLTFYISSLSSLTDNRIRYKTKVISRTVQANTACYIEFEQGKADIRENRGNNPAEMGRIKENLVSLVEDKVFDLDSIVITASCSPEGSWESNRKLSVLRSESVSRHYQAFLKRREDSLRRSQGVMLSMDESYRAAQKAPIRFIPHYDAENWDMLDALVEKDSTLARADKDRYGKIRETADPDTREKMLQELSGYRYLRENLYPRLRTVRFDFHLHRKGMVKDTVHTTEVDSTYMLGLEALREREYEKALSLLREYRDYNTAIAYVSLDYNASAMDILKDLEKAPQVNYMLALLYARKGDDQNAVQYYLNACHEDRSYVFRGNLDPEINVLIQRYGLNREEEEIN